MKLPLAVALLFFSLAYAQPRFEHQLKQPQFHPGKTHYYDVTINMTSGVPGMSAQVAKSVIQTELKIFPKTHSHLIIQMERVRVGESHPGVESPSDDVTLTENNSLEQELRVPCSVIYENGKIKSYSVSPTESLEARKIRKSILRNFELYLDEKSLGSASETDKLPLTYNVTKSSPGGSYESHYIVTSSPYYDFPYEQNVFNVTRFDNYEGIPYIAYHTHHNYRKQGCPEVCSHEEYSENKYGAGCPAGHEPHRSPVKRSFVQRHNLLTVGSTLIIDSIHTKETHLADVYDQNMEVTVETEVKFKKTSKDVIPEPSSQQIVSDLNDISKDIDEEEIEHICQYPDSKSSVDKVKSLLNEVVETVLKNEMQEEKSQKMGEMLVTLQKMMQRFRQGDFRVLQGTLVSYSSLKQSSEKEKIKRQIWLDLLPLVGTSESVSYIVSYIRESIESGRDLSWWESQSILNSLPTNIHRPNEKTINELSTLLETLKNKNTLGHGHMLFASAHMAVAKVISSLCSRPVTVEQQSGSFSWRKWILPSTVEDESNKFLYNMNRKCPESLTRKFIDEVAHELKNTHSKTKRIVYLEVLSQTGLEAVLPILKEYIHGHPHIFKGLSQSYVDYLRTATIYSLHSIVNKARREVQDIVAPVFFNSTESPKVRTAAFGVLLRTKPTLNMLELVAYHSWQEPSQEVGSYVTSALEKVGNSSMPCHQILAQRIKMVLPQMKRFSIGEHHAKTLLFNYWNDVSQIGLLKHLEYMPSNESIIPSALYGHSEYFTGSMADNFFQFALLPQGFSAPKIFDKIMQMLGLPKAEDIPKNSENKIFEDMNIESRNSEPWRLIGHSNIWYSAFNYYFDQEDEMSSRRELVKMVKEVLDHYVQKDSQGRYTGHFTKLFIPASFHTKTVSQSLPYPVQFEKKSPILFSLKVKSEKTSSDGLKLHIIPSVYSSIIHTNEIMNVGDCKRIGVYLNHRTMITYPVTVNLQIQKDSGKLTFSYKFPELPNSIVSHTSEAGTYAGKSYMEPFPSVADRRTIKTIPAQFVNSFSWNILGLPMVRGLYKTEDIEHGTMPRTWREVCEHLHMHVLNAGWRRRSLEIVRERDSETWTPDTEIVFKVQYSKYLSTLGKSGSESNWSRDLEFEDPLDKHDTTSYATEGQKIYQKFTTTLSHIKHSIVVKTEQKTRSSSEKTGEFNLEYFHTPGGFLHLVHFNSSCWTSSRPLEVTGDYAVGFIRKPNEFKYNERYGEQKGLALGSLSWSKTTPFTNPFVVAKAVFKYKPLNEVLLNLDSSVDLNEYEPDTHRQCMEDKQNGIHQSPACVKAIREKSIYNNLRMQAIWTQEPPMYFKKMGHKLDSVLKYAFYSHMNVSSKEYLRSSEERSNSFLLEATYIDKMTNRPLLDIVMEKPNETLNFTKISLGKFRPMSSIESITESYAAFMTNNSYPATCSMTGNFVKTYDMKTYRMPTNTPECSYVLSTHCTENKKFSVLVKHDPNTHATKEIHVYLGQNEIVLVPGSRSSYRVQYNGQYQTVRYLAPVVLNEESLLTAVVHATSDGGSFLELSTKRVGIKVLYDGEHIKVQVDPRYKGELCGLCSEFNGEEAREYRGVDGCLYMNEEDFAKSSIIGQCRGVEKRPQHGVICNNNRQKWGRENSQEEDDYEPTTKRNIVTSRGNELCFSTKPVPVCENNAQPMMVESRVVDFHCLPKQDVHARKMVTESKRRILGELETKAVDYTETVEVAKMC